MKSDVYNSDCLEAMRQMPDNAFDLAIVDPPYGIGIVKQLNSLGRGVATSTKHAAKEWDGAVPSDEYFRELRRVSVNQIVWGGNYFDLPKTRGWVIWQKMDITNDFNPIEMAWTSNLKMGFFRFLWCGLWQEDMKNKERRVHPTQKPVALYKWLLTNYAKAGDSILDTHLGSGSSRIAAYDLGFDFTGYELDKDYYMAQGRRFAHHKAQPKLFEPLEATATQGLIFA